MGILADPATVNYEYWATDSTVNIIQRAIQIQPGIAGHVTSLTEYPDISWGPNNRPHAEHKAGWSIDVGFNGNYPSNSSVLLDVTLTPQAMLAALTPREREIVNEILAIYNSAGSQFVRVLIGGQNGQRTYPRIRQS